jgi:hypothetical protein
MPADRNSIRTRRFGRRSLQCGRRLNCDHLHWKFEAKPFLEINRMIISFVCRSSFWRSQQARHRDQIARVRHGVGIYSIQRPDHCQMSALQCMSFNTSFNCSAYSLRNTSKAPTVRAVLQTFYKKWCLLGACMRVHDSIQLSQLVCTFRFFVCSCYKSAFFGQLHFYSVKAWFVNKFETRALTFVIQSFLHLLIPH